MTKKKKKSKALVKRHVDSVVHEDDDPYVEVLGPSVPPPPRQERSLERTDGNSAVQAAAKQLLRDAKEGYARAMATRSFAGGSTAVRLTLETDEEVEGATLLESMGKGKLYKLGGDWVFELNEQDHAFDGVLGGSVLQPNQEDEEREKDEG